MIPKTSVPHSRKRQLSIESETYHTGYSSESPPPKRRRKSPFRTPPRFWDNLSILWLVPSALQEFDRRTVWPAVPSSPDRSGEDRICLENLKRFAKHGGPSLGDLRPGPGPPEPESEDQADSKDSSGFNRRLRQNLIDHGVYPAGYGGFGNAQKPRNWEEINARLIGRAHTRMSIMWEPFRIMAGSTDVWRPSEFSPEMDILFDNLRSLTNGSIRKARPDIYDGSRGLDFRVRNDLQPFIVPSRTTSAGWLPNFFIEFKADEGDATVCKTQALYDGALGARGMHEIRSYVDSQTAYDDNAYTITVTYDDGPKTLTMYTTHPAQHNNPRNPKEFRKHKTRTGQIIREPLVPDGQPRYYMTQLRAFAMTDSPETFRQGATALRNLRDWAKEQRDEAIRRANERVKQSR